MNKQLERMTDEKYYDLILADGYDNCWDFPIYDDIYTRWYACCKPSKKYPMWIALHWNRNTDNYPPHVSIHYPSNIYNSPHPSTLITKILIPDDFPRKLTDINPYPGYPNVPYEYKKLILKWIKEPVSKNEFTNWGHVRVRWDIYERSYLDRKELPQHIYDQLNQDEFQKYG